MRHSRRGHQLGDADRIESLGAKQFRRRIHRARAVFRSLSFVMRIRAPLDYDDDIIIDGNKQVVPEMDMLAQALSRRFARSGFYYGWMIVAVAFLVSLSTAGVMGLPGALILPLGPRIRLEY